MQQLKIQYHLVAIAAVVVAAIVVAMTTKIEFKNFKSQTATSPSFWSLCFFLPLLLLCGSEGWNSLL
jgi:hypothetical protein